MRHGAWAARFIFLDGGGKEVEAQDYVKAHGVRAVRTAAGRPVWDLYRIEDSEAEEPEFEYVDTVDAAEFPSAARIEQWLYYYGQAPADEDEERDPPDVGFR